MGKKGISITPFYDILNTAMYNNFYGTKLAMSIGDNFELEKTEYSDLVDLADDLGVKTTFLINKFKNLLQKTKKALKFLEKEEIDESFKKKYKEDILQRLDRLWKIVSF